MQDSTLTSTTELAGLSDLVELIYQAATEPSRWDVILPAIASWVGASCAMMFTPLTLVENGGFLFNHAVPESIAKFWWAHYYTQDLWATRFIARGLTTEGNVLSGDDVMSFEELSHTDIYRDHLSMHDTVHLLSGIVHGNKTPQTNPYAVCRFLRGVKDGAFTSAERERLAILIPHISRSLGVMVRLRDAELSIAASLSSLDHLSAGVLLFDAGGLVSFANRAALLIMAEGDGLKLQHPFACSTLRHLIAADRVAQDALACAINSAIALNIQYTTNFSHAVLVPRLSGKQAYTISFSSLAAQNKFGSGTGTDAPFAIAFIADNTSQTHLDANMLQKTYGLSKAEVRVAALLTECLTVAESAKRLGLSIGTVKTQLQSIYIKTNTNSHSKLMKLIISLSQLAE